MITVPRPGRRLHPDPAAHRLGAVCHARQAAAQPDRGGREPHSIIGDYQVHAFGHALHSHRGGRRAGMFGGVLQRLQSAEVERGLEVGPHPVQPLTVTCTGNGPPVAAPDGGCESVVGEPARVDASGERRHGVDGVVDGGLEAAEDRRRPLRGSGHQRAGQAQVHRQRHEVLLGPVVDVALQSPPLLVLGCDDPLAGGTERPELARCSP